MVSVTTRGDDHLATAQSSGPNLGLGIEESWLRACDELGLDLVRQRGGSFLRSTATGFIDGHDVSISLVGGTRHERFVRTMYSVRFDAAHAPTFSLRMRSDDDPPIDTGNPYFDQKVAVVTDSAAGLKTFLTPSRRTRIMHMLLRWPSVTISNHLAHVCTEGIEDDFDTLVASARRLVETAEAFGQTSNEVRLDEANVLRDLFGSGRNVAGVRSRFDQRYNGRSVAWCGEVLQVGAVDRAGQRVAVLLGSADGRDTASGRVVALAALDPAMRVTHGDVVNVTGRLLNLDPRKRLFRIE